VIIDAHTHVWPDAVAGRALAAAGLKDLESRGDGTVASLVETMASAGVDRAICLAVANTPDRVEAANRFAGQLPEHLIGFGSAHAGVDPDELVASLRRHGLPGVKVHPLFQDYGLDDPGLAHVLEALGDEFVAIVHVGAGKDDATNARCTPAMLRDLARRFPRLKLVACHFGGYRLLDEAEELVQGLPIHLDTSWPPSLAEVDPARIRRSIERHGPERIVFASDWPMADPAAEIAVIEGLSLDDDTTSQILGGNMARLLGL
jgi:uncharacterized protein